MNVGALQPDEGIIHVYIGGVIRIHVYNAEKVYNGTGIHVCCIIHRIIHVYSV